MKNWTIRQNIGRYKGDVEDLFEILLQIQGAESCSMSPETIRNRRSGLSPAVRIWHGLFLLWCTWFKIEAITENSGQPFAFSVIFLSGLSSDGTDNANGYKDGKRIFFRWVIKKQLENFPASSFQCAQKNPGC